ncbi:MAG: DUF6491 family protein [Thermomonas sp.]
MKALLLPLVVIGCLSACATNRMSDTDRLSMYQAHAGEPVSQIRNYNGMGWDRVDDQHVVLNMRPKESWLVKISGPCLDWGNGSPTLHIKSQGTYLMPKLDRIFVNGSPVSCRIEEIRPIDVAGLRAAQESVAAQAPSGT